MTATSASPQKQCLLTDLPDEVLQHILYYCSANHVLFNVQRLSKRFARLASEPLLWRYHCRVEFKYWDSKHRIRQKFLGNVVDVDWKALYTYRSRVDAQTTALLDSILEGQIDRISKFRTISEFGYDTKDTLVRHCHTHDDAEDVLARRYYATAVLDHVHRSKALAEWRKVLHGEKVPLERALGAFDMFVLHDQHGDLQEISDLFDDLAIRLRREHPGLNHLPPRKKALIAVKFLREHNYVGLSSELAYRDLQNNFIGIALQDQDHPSLPLISVGIFCALAQRLGLNARCCGIPNHVHAMVIPAPGETLDDRPLREGEIQAQPMFLDPYRFDDEISEQSLRIMLSQYGIRPHQFAEFMADTGNENLILRTSRNILATVQEFRAQVGAATNTGHPTIRLYANPFADMDNAFYAALWANYIFGNPARTMELTTQRQFIPLILERFERLYPMDATLIEEYIVPQYGRQDHISEIWELREALRVVRAADQTPKQRRLRDTPAAREGVKYKVGQIFRHRRYAYTGVITGWDMECGMTSAWIAHNNVDSLSRGRHQSFYHALVEDTSVRYVAEENIEVIEPEVPSTLMSLAGKFFKRWDKENRIFVSNIRDEYPED
ncbi:uncharacterized protein PAC_07288 [Phialocephala subalpina]|uniref:F-box domain-containing protein n=1 Tax=Phialocephala subalpina TaxID=576137 RepID=A0A1L7WXB1_9HELO|nr:uncharacterized protein PAC_07288 [Phialocephala subalpina]